MKKRVLIIGDELKTALEDTEGFTKLLYSNPSQLPQDISKNDPHVTILDGDIFDLQWARHIKKLLPHRCLILCISPENLEKGLGAVRAGIAELILKPFAYNKLETILQKRHKEVHLPPSSFVAKSEIMNKILKEVKQIAKSESNIFIMGESGTGKEEIAKLIHLESLRSTQPLIKVNCAAIPDTLIESEFFGHEKGAFTSAHSRRLGRLELANRGTLLLDEVTEISLPLQAKLLRVVQELEFERLGGTSPIKVDVRLISTSNREMKIALQNKFFREDLFYRLNVIPIFLPSLRERPEDILPLVEYFIAKVSEKNGCMKKVLTPQAEKILLSYDWPGNVRELANVIEHAIIIDQGIAIDEKHMRIKIPKKNSIYSPSKITLDELEKQHILNTLQSYANNKTKAAKALGISVRTLRNKLKIYGLY